MLKPDISEQIMKLMGQYIIDNAKDLIPIAYSNLTGNEIMLRIMRRNDKPCHQKTHSQGKCTTSDPTENAGCFEF